MVSCGDDRVVEGYLFNASIRVCVEGVVEGWLVVGVWWSGEGVVNMYEHL